VKLCKDCKYYKAGGSVESDMCTHKESSASQDYNGIREELPIRLRTCYFMRQMKCECAALFEAAK